MRKVLLLLAALGCVEMLSAAEPVKRNKPEERINKSQLQSSDKLFRYTVSNPCHLDKYEYFCCPVRKIVRRKRGEGSWIDYCYNEKDELIGIRRGNHSASVKRSDFSTVGGCSRCGNTKIRQRAWRHTVSPKLAPAKKKKRR